MNEFSQKEQIRMSNFLHQLLRRWSDFAIFSENGVIFCLFNRQIVVAFPQKKVQFAERTNFCTHIRCETGIWDQLKSGMGMQEQQLSDENRKQKLLFNVIPSIFHDSVTLNLNDPFSHPDSRYIKRHYIPRLCVKERRVRRKSASWIVKQLGHRACLVLLRTSRLTKVRTLPLFLVLVSFSKF